MDEIEVIFIFFYLSTIGPFLEGRNATLTKGSTLICMAFGTVNTSNPSNACESYQVGMNPIEALQGGRLKGFTAMLMVALFPPFGITFVYSNL